MILSNFIVVATMFIVKLKYRKEILSLSIHYNRIHILFVKNYTFLIIIPRVYN